VIWLS